MARRIFKNPWRSLASWAAHLPSQCAVCGSWPTERVCEACVARFAQPCTRCRTCALPVVGGTTQCGECLRHPPPLDACIAAVDYAYPWAGLLAEFKFQGDPGWAAPFAALLRSTPWAEPAIEAADWLVPLPLAAQRLGERGFNQAQRIALCLGAQKTRDDLLLRLRPAADQHALGRSGRLRNLHGVFAAEPLNVGLLQGRRLLLVDDVMTTGATLYAAARVLRDAGATQVGALVVARADVR
ncbi:MAG: ComF family protein [Giesbergeria sp.]